MLSPQQLLGKMGAVEDLVVCDLEAGVISLNGLDLSEADLVLVVTEPSKKSIDAAQRLAAIASKLSAQVVVVGNRVQTVGDRTAIEAAMAGYDLVLLADDPAIRLADRDGLAPIDAAPDSVSMLALTELATHIVQSGAPKG